MKKIVFIALPLLLLACTPKQAEYTLVWEDNFDSLNVCYWNLDDNARGGGNAELQYYAPKNVTIEKHPVSGETCLVLNAQREDYYYTTAEGKQGYRPATSARLNTQDKVTVEYGMVEARIAFPYTANGLWPAFWMLGNNLATNLGDDDSVDDLATALEKQGRVVWPKCGEIDVCEMGHSNGIKAGTQERYFNGACHWGESWNNGAYPNVGKFHTWDYSVQGDFHLFTLIWTEDSIAMYLDLDRCPKAKNDDVCADSKVGGLFPDAQPYFELSLRDKTVNEPGHYFNHPFYLVLNLSVGGFFPGIPNPEKYSDVIDASLLDPVTALPEDGTPVKMYVDYIRVYKAK